MSKFKGRVLEYSPSRDDTLIVDVTGDCDSIESYTSPSEVEADHLDDAPFSFFPNRSSTPLPGKNFHFYCYTVTVTLLLCFNLLSFLLLLCSNSLSILLLS